VLGDENRAFRQMDSARIPDDPHAPADAPRAAAESLTFFCILWDGGIAALKRMPLVNDPSRLEPVRWREFRFVSVEFALPDLDERSQVRTRRSAIDELENFVDFEMEHVTRVVEQVERMKASAQFHEDAPHSTEQPRSLEA
jgi:hypothetical protein